jgi:hypothetical protein
MHFIVEPAALFLNLNCPLFHFTSLFTSFNNKIKYLKCWVNYNPKLDFAPNSNYFTNFIVRSNVYA